MCVYVIYKRMYIFRTHTFLLFVLPTANLPRADIHLTMAVERKEEGEMIELALCKEKVLFVNHVCQVHSGRREEAAACTLLPCDDSRRHFDCTRRIDAGEKPSYS